MSTFQLLSYIVIFPSKLLSEFGRKKSLKNKRIFYNQAWHDTMRHIVVYDFVFFNLTIKKPFLRLCKTIDHKHASGISFYCCCVNDDKESNRKAMNRNWSNQKANTALKTKAGNK